MEEDDAVHRHLGVVFGNDFLTRHIQHCFFHVDLAVGALPQRHDEVETGFEGAVVAAKTEHGAFRALIHNLDGTTAKPKCEDNQDDDEDGTAAELGSKIDRHDVLLGFGEM